MVPVSCPHVRQGIRAATLSSLVDQSAILCDLFRQLRAISPPDSFGTLSEQCHQSYRCNTIKIPKEHNHHIHIDTSVMRWIPRE
jgi:hypothetical protein